MEEFKELENLWKQSETEVPAKKSNLSTIKSNRMKLKNTYIKGAVLLILTGIFILVLLYNFDAVLQTTPIISSVILVAAACFLQALLMLFTANKITKIDESHKPGTHLKQWQDFREFQKNQRHWNMPVYYIILGAAVGVYLYEMLKNVEPWKMILALSITYAWLFFAYFYLGKKEIKRQDAKLDGILSELKNLENQFH
ncbi:hypothetical protein [Kaistella palustris]|uniref:hypothetical protein n=1 Tax=Kaistella palustris TaxID=493376 RepID=UPI00041AB358|nr:hypothetical protein [Kaistella palustris]